MNYGIEINNPKYKKTLGINIRSKRLEEMGYKKVPNHFESDLQVDEQWITNTDKFGNSHFPRFHIIKDKGRSFIHYDFIQGEKHITIVVWCKQIKEEIKRLKYYAIYQNNNLVC